MKLRNHKVILDNIKNSEWFDTSLVKKQYVTVMDVQNVNSAESNSNGVLKQTKKLILFDRTKGNSGIYMNKFLREVDNNKYKPRNQKAEKIKRVIIKNDELEI